MIAQVEASRPAEESDAHRLSRQDSRRFEARNQTLETGARAQRIGQNTTHHASVDGVLQRFHHARGRAVVGDDVEEQMHVVTRGIYISDETIDESIVVGQYFGGVATENRQLPQLLCQRDGLVQLDADIGVRDIGFLGKPLENRSAQVFKLQMSLQAPPRQRRPADQCIQNQPCRGLEENEQQPTFGGFGGASERHDNDHRQPHDPLGDEENVDP